MTVNAHFEPRNAGDVAALLVSHEALTRQVADLVAENTRLRDVLRHIPQYTSWEAADEPDKGWAWVKYQDVADALGGDA